MDNPSQRDNSGRLLFVTILLLFFLSGSSGLVYQVIWVRLLTRVFGTTTFAVSSLLAAFMAGLGLGAYLSGRYLVRFRSPLRWFGALEVGIGIYALSLNILLPWAERLFVDLLSGSGLSLYQESVLKIVLSFVILLPPTTLMGASLPLLVQQTVDRMGYLGVRTGSLYALNTFGAAAGCFAAGFFIIARLGLAATTEIAAAVNAFVGLTAVILSFVPSGSRPRKPTPPDSEEHRETSTLRWAMAAFTISGFAAIGLEVVWTRLFTLVFKGYTYSFSAMLTVVLTGIAVGSIAFARRADRSEDLQGLLGRIQVSAAIAVLALGPAFLFADYLLSYLYVQLGFDWFGTTLSKFVVSFVILFLPTFLFGAQFPVVSKLATDRVEAAGGRVGDLYAANVVGSILGALVTGFVFIPLIGTHSSLWVLSGSLLLSGTLLLTLGPLKRARTRWVPLIGPITAAVLFAFYPSNLSLAIHESWLDNEEFISFYKEGTTATVMVGDFPSELSEHERILVNGSSASNSTLYGLSVNRIQGCLPFLFEQMPKNVLAVCFGTGITFGTLGQFDVERIDGVDISPEVIEAAPEFAEENYGVVENDRVTIHIDDGRNFLLKSKETYDVITMEPMPPALAGVVDMYTREFYALSLEHLAPGGIMSQWVPLYYLGYDDIRMLYRTFAESFPYVLAFSYSFDTFLVGSNQPLVLSPEKYRERLHSDALVRDLAMIGLSAPEEMAGTFLMDREALLELAGDAPIVTDDLPYVEFTAPKSADMEATAPNYLAVTRYASPVLPYLREGSDPDFERLRAALQRTYEQNLERWSMAREAQRKREGRHTSR